MSNIIWKTTKFHVASIREDGIYFMAGTKDIKVLDSRGSFYIRQRNLGVDPRSIKAHVRSGVVFCDINDHFELSVDRYNQVSLNLIMGD